MYTNNYDSCCYPGEDAKTQSPPDTNIMAGMLRKILVRRESGLHFKLGIINIRI